MVPEISKKEKTQISWPLHRWQVEYFHLCQPRLIVRAAWLRIHQLLALNVGQLSSGSFRSCPSSLWMSLVLMSLVWFSFFLSEMRISSFGIWMNPILEFWLIFIFIKLCVVSTLSTTTARRTGQNFQHFSHIFSPSFWRFVHLGSAYVLRYYMGIG